MLLSSNSPRSRQQDLSRFLDPSYVKHSPPTSATTTTWAYIDHTGEYHDPDFRDFPVLTSLYNNNPNRRSTSSRTASPRTSPRPHWELHLDDEVNMDDEDVLEDEDDGSFFLSNAPHPQNHHRYAHSSSRRSQNNPEHRRTREALLFSPATYSPSTTASTLPTSYESDFYMDRSASPFMNSAEEKERCGGLLLLNSVKKLRRSSGQHRRTSLDLPTTAEEEDYHDSDKEKHESPSSSREDRHVVVEDEEARFEEDEERRTEYVPTCSEALRRQWLSFSLRVQFKIFRTRRRLVNRVNSLF